MSYYSLAKDRANPEHQKAIALEKRQAHRVCELARHEGIPPTGALTLLRNDPKTQGPRLFAQNCASCHDHAAGNDPLDDIKAEKSSAPNLAGFASRAVDRRPVEPEADRRPAIFRQHEVPQRQDGRLREGDARRSGRRRKRRISKRWSSPSRPRPELPAQKAADAKDAKIIAEGRKLVDRRSRLHRLPQVPREGQVGRRPELTGYGSPQWIAGIIRNPADRRFYGKLNDRMPAYAASETDPAQNTLNPRQIEMLTDWLRGQWYEEEEDGSWDLAFVILGTRTLASLFSGRRHGGPVSVQATVPAAAKHARRFPPRPNLPSFPFSALFSPQELRKRYSLPAWRSILRIPCGVNTAERMCLRSPPVTEQRLCCPRCGEGIAIDPPQAADRLPSL